jgi:S-formylglutathione hydrolase
MEQIGNNKCFGGFQQRFRFESKTLSSTTTFSIYLPPGASADAPVPVIYWLSGLTCTDENFVIKAGAQQYAAAHGVAVVAPDTSPRGDNVPGDPDGGWDIGLGAGYYVDATQDPWRQHYQMYSFITKELPPIIEREFPVTNKKAIMGHSMGGHGALTIALKNPGAYTSVSAFAPICAPSQTQRGTRALSLYLGDDPSAWQEYDTCALVAKGTNKIPFLVDQGTADNFMVDRLLPEKLQQACEKAQHPLNLRMREGYDHGYFFVATFIGEHVVYHAEHLKK